MPTPEGALRIRFGDDGLISAVIVDAATGSVLMVGFMNDQALTRTRESGLVHFWSRSRQKLWKKGESSGHVQHVREIRVNCEMNSVLIEVEQDGAVCHDGYDTCYYRRLNPDDTLTIVRDRQFDPDDVYPAGGTPSGLASTTMAWWQAYEYLRDTALAAESGTSKRLRGPEDVHTPRIADELRELAGVIAGSHRHRGLQTDLRLEAGQVFYWATCSAIWQGQSWDSVRPDRALDVTAGKPPSADTLARLLAAQADLIETLPEPPSSELIHDTMSLVGTILRAHGIEPIEVIRADLADLRSKPYAPA